MELGGVAPSSWAAPAVYPDQLHQQEHHQSNSAALLYARSVRLKSALQSNRGMDQERGDSCSARVAPTAATTSSTDMAALLRRAQVGTLTVLNHGPQVLYTARFVRVCG